MVQKLLLPVLPKVLRLEFLSIPRTEVFRFQIGQAIQRASPYRKGHSDYWRGRSTMPPEMPPTKPIALYAENKDL